MTFDRIYLDSNVIIRAFEASPDDDVAQDLVGMMGLVRIGEPARFVTSHITLAEVLVHPTRAGDEFLTQRYLRLLSSSSPWLQVRSVNQSVLVRAAGLRAHSRLKLPDAIHAATALEADCSHIMSADSDFPLVVNAQDVALPMPIRPTREVVDTLIARLRT